MSLIIDEKRVTLGGEVAILPEGGMEAGGWAEWGSAEHSWGQLGESRRAGISPLVAPR